MRWYRKCMHVPVARTSNLTVKQVMPQQPSQVLCIGKDAMSYRRQLRISPSYVSLPCTCNYNIMSKFTPTAPCQVPNSHRRPVPS